MFLQGKLDKIEEVVDNNSGQLDDLLGCNSCNNNDTGTGIEKGNRATILFLIVSRQKIKKVERSLIIN